MRTRTCDMVWWTIQRVRVEFQLSSHWLLVRFGRAYRLPEPLLRLLIEAQVRFVQYVGTYSRKSSSSICSRSLSSFPPSRYSARSSFLSVRPTEGPAEFVVREGRPVRLYRRRGWGRVLGPARGAIGGGLRRASTPVQRRCHLGVHVGQLFAHFPHRERDFLGFLARLRTNLLGFLAQRCQLAVQLDVQIKIRNICQLTCTCLVQDFVDAAAAPPTSQLALHQRWRDQCV